LFDTHKRFRKYGKLPEVWLIWLQTRDTYEQLVVDQLSRPVDITPGTYESTYIEER